MQLFGKFLFSSLLLFSVFRVWGDSDGGHSDGGHSDGGSSSSSSSTSEGGSGGSHPGSTEHDFLRFFEPMELMATASKPTTSKPAALTGQAELLALQKTQLHASGTPTVPATALSTQRLTTPLAPAPAVAIPLVQDDLKYRPLLSDTADDVAVIIENASYKESSIPHNSAAVHDAQFFKRFAIEGLGIQARNIIYLKNATKAELLKVFGSERRHEGQLSDWIRPGKSRIYVYYAGHGAPSEESDAFLIPSDADSTYLELNGYPVSTLFKNISMLNAKHATVVLESCFSGVSQVGSIISQASPLFLKPKKTVAPKNVTVVSASQIHQIASWEKSEPRSLFTKYFLKAMSGEADRPPYGNADGQVSEAELSQYLGDTLSYWARRYYGREQRAQIQNWELK